MKAVILILSILSFFQLFSQSGKNRIEFQKNNKDLFGFDRYSNGLWSEEYANNELNGALNFKVAYKSLAKNKAGFVNVHYLDVDSIDLKLVKVEIHSTKESVVFSRIDGQHFELSLPAKNEDYTVDVVYNSFVIGQIDVIVYDLQIKKIALVPMNGAVLRKDSIERQLNSMLFAANVRFEVQILPDFSAKEFSKMKKLSRTSLNREKYTLQMRSIRDLYLIENPKFDKSVPLIFVLPEFEDPLRTEYGVMNKALGFVSNRNIARNILRFYLTGALGGKYVDEEFPIRKSVTNNLLDENDGLELRKSQWELIRNGTLVISYNDDYEHVITNNGIVAYYSWKLNPDGSIYIKNGSFLASINRPFKKNTYSYHLEINTFFYKTLFTIYGKPVNLIHILGVVLLLFVWIWLGRKLRKWLKTKYQRSRIFRFLSRLTQWTAMVFTIYFFILLVDYGYSMFEVKNGNIEEFEGKSVSKVQQLLAENMHPKKLEEKRICSEIIVEKAGNYDMLQRSAVLYFDAKTVNGKVKNLQLKSTSNKLIVSSLNLNEKVQSHYLVLTETDEDGQKKERLYNHLGIELTKKANLRDPAKRILLFVNGYRPTSLGNSIEQNISDIKNKGLEFPNSYNQVFAYDRYNYWHPWNAIDDLFKERINPSDIYYVDGHHSVETSNHRSLINFTTISATYPKRCQNQRRHHCHYMSSVKGKLLGSRRIETYKAHRRRSNKNGFEKRRSAGRIAGRNILQLLNERPNFSKNDTLFIVAHSMGYAYSLGVVDVLKDKISLGEYYILAAENAGGGKVSLRDWQAVFQYGSKFNEKSREYPCLQDGIAPQTAVGGLGEDQRLYIPKENYKQKGFFDSHFVGYYTWVFEISEGKKGWVRQH